MSLRSRDRSARPGVAWLAVLVLPACAAQPVGDDGGATARLLLGTGALATQGAAPPTGGASAPMIDPEMTPDPESFSAEATVVWDGERTLQGVWIAHPEARSARRVRIVNLNSGAAVDGALFRRDAGAPPSETRISSDAAVALGLEAGERARVEITALRYAAPSGAEGPEATAGRGTPGDVAAPGDGSRAAAGDGQSPPPATGGDRLRVTPEMQVGAGGAAVRRSSTTGTGRAADPAPASPDAALSEAGQRGDRRPAPRAASAARTGEAALADAPARQGDERSAPSAAAGADAGTPSGTSAAGSAAPRAVPDAGRDDLPADSGAQAQLPQDRGADGAAAPGGGSGVAPPRQADSGPGDPAADAPRPASAPARRTAMSPGTDDGQGTPGSVAATDPPGDAGAAAEAPAEVRDPAGRGDASAGRAAASAGRAAGGGPAADAPRAAPDGAGPGGEASSAPAGDAAEASGSPRGEASASASVRVAARPREAATSAGDGAPARPYVQAGIFAVPANAARLIDRLRAAGLPAAGKPFDFRGRPATRVVAGPFPSAAARDAALAEIRRIGPDDALPVKE